jgi:hypothetical protein
MALNEVQVTSRHTHTHKDKHHGIEYTFPPNEKVLIPLKAAQHIFGGTPEERTAAGRRLGLTQAKSEPGGKKGWDDYFAKFDVKVVELVPQDSSLEELKEEHAKVVETVKKQGDEALLLLMEDHATELDSAQKTIDGQAAQIKVLTERIAELEVVPTPTKGKGAKG